MNRRLFLASAGALIAAPAALHARENTADYEPGLIQEKLDAGETVFVDYAAVWCGTCKRQERIVDNLRAKNPEFDEKITFITVDWDLYGRHEVATSRRIPRRSTLVLLRGDEELGRIVAGTNPGDINALLELGLADA